jgi:hypothetical protein
MPMTTPQASPAAGRFEPAAQAPVMPLPIIAMANFRRLMSLEGWSVDLARMCVDRSYAFERLACAHTSSHERLRHAALELFAAYDRNASVAAVH